MSKSIIEAIAASHNLWIGCGDLLRRTHNAVVQLKKLHGVEFTFIDVCDPDKVKQPPPGNAKFYNVSHDEQRQELRKFLRQHPLTNIFIANWPPQHLLTAFKYSEFCSGRIIISKPLDVNLPLIETIAGRGAWPADADKIFVHDHYRNKGAVWPTYQAFPRLIHLYGKIKSFELYLVECKTVEEEGRLEALNEGVIFDLASHLFALIQLFFLEGHRPALAVPGLKLKQVSLRINRVARARYALCQIENQEAETFAAIDVTLVAEYSKSHRSQPIVYNIPGLLVVGKGIKPSQSISAGLKGMRFNQELQPRSVNLTRNEVNPPLSDLQFADNNWGEDGFNAPLVSAFSQNPPAKCNNGEKIAAMMPFMQAARNAEFIGESIRIASPLLYYRDGDTLDTVMAKCVGAGQLDHRWLSEAGFADIGFG